jgi:thiol-disulfide isomerase/thioredoxin
VLLVNFWATWCGPCRAEIPHLIATQTRHGASGLQVIGIAIDQMEKVVPFSTELGINYQVLIDDSNGIGLSRRFGNHAGIVPFTALVDRHGQVIATRTGALSQEQIELLLRDRLLAFCTSSGEQLWWPPRPG